VVFRFAFGGYKLGGRPFSAKAQQHSKESSNTIKDGILRSAGLRFSSVKTGTKVQVKKITNYIFGVEKFSARSSHGKDFVYGNPIKAKRSFVIQIDISEFVSGVLRMGSWRSFGG
jgi:hypothetical protein